MESKSPDRSRSASDSPRISGRDPSTHELHSANAMPVQSCCHNARTVASNESTARRLIFHRASCFYSRTRNAGIPSFRAMPIRAISQTLPFNLKGGSMSLDQAGDPDRGVGLTVAPPSPYVLAPTKLLNDNLLGAELVHNDRNHLGAVDLGGPDGRTGRSTGD